MRVEISENQNAQDLENFIEILKLKSKGASVRVEKDGEKFYLVIE